ncbi:MAG: SPOR domain-containing protein [Bacteroidaceae bacterium]|nr:SPOR domain-containing protein [Bacteroidaceae bacterium]
MKILVRHIETLLLEHDCVIVQGLGGFIANQMPARYNAAEGLFLPPYRAVMFNQQLRENDGLLTQSYMQTFDAAYPEALCQLEKDVDQLSLSLDQDGEVQVGSIGTLRKDLEGHIKLTPHEAGILTPALYGLYPLGIKTLAQLKEEQEEKARIVPIQKEEAEPKAEPHIAATAAAMDEPKPQKKIPMLIDFGIAAAVAAIMFLLFSAPALRTPQIEEDSCIAGTLLASPATDTPTKSQAQNTRAPRGNADNREETAPTQQQPTGRYTLVLACYVSEKNARLFIEHLTEAGYNGAEFVGGKVTRILYGQYATEEEATQSLRKLRKENNSFAQAWVMENKTRKV